jgi:pimeloyl-ACP methyl ester carboxylesterase
MNMIVQAVVLVLMLAPLTLCDGNTTLLAPKSDAEVRVDAMPLEWAYTPPIAFGSRDIISPKAVWEGPHDLSALLRCMWDEKALYLLIEVCDDEITMSGVADNSDRILLALETDVGGKFGVSLSPNSNGGNAFDIKTNLPLLDDGTWAVGVGKGYWLSELCIPWEKLSVAEPSKGLKLRLSLEVVDVDSANETKKLTATDKTSCVFVVLDERKPKEILADKDALSGACLMVKSTDELLPNSELQFDILIPLILWGISGVDVSVVDQVGNEFELKALVRERMSVFWRWKYAWVVPPEAAGSYSARIELRDVNGKAIASIMRDLGSATQITLLDVSAQIDELVREARMQTFQARKRGDEVSCGRWATLLFHANKLREDFQRMMNEEPAVETARAFKARLNDLYAMLKNIHDGKDPFEGRTGVVERAYLSDLDDTLQPYAVYIPPIYYDVILGKRFTLPQEFRKLLEEDEELAKALDFASFKLKGFPMVVQLHGLGGTHMISAPPPSNPLWGVIILSPFGRGPTDYKVWGEVDVLCAIREAMRAYRVDEDRVYMTGVSMGGTGCWQIATHYPDIFAAIAPVCGNADHRVWEREWNWGQKERTFMSEVRDFMENCESPVFLAENLMHVPVYCVHGDADEVVPVGHSRSMVGRLRELGYSVIYDEQKGVGHGGFYAGTFEKLYKWLLKQVRNRNPKRITYKTGWLRYRGAYWVEINRFERYLDFATISAEIVGQNAISVRTSNVAHFTLRLNDNIVDTSKEVSVSINGEFVYRGSVGKDGRLSFAKRNLPDGTCKWVVSKPPEGLVKSAQLEGPIETAFLSRFIIAYGTIGEEPAEAEVNESEARKLAAHWARWASGRAIVKRDVDITEEDLKTANIILVGNAKNNLLIKRINAFLPIRFDVGENAIVMANGLRFSGDDVGVKMVYPSPLNPRKLVVVIGGVTSKATNDVMRRFGNWFDWGVLDHRKWFDFGIYDSKTRDPETFLAVGFFDQDWMLSNELTFYGDALLRREAPAQTQPEKLWAGASERVVYLSDIKPVRFSSDKGPLGLDRTTDGYKLTLGGKQYEKGLSVHPDAEIVYEIGGRFKAFECVVGIDTSGEKPVSRARELAETVTFQVFGDEKLLAEVTDVKWNTPPRRIAVSVEGVNRLRLVAKKQGGARWLYGKVDFADAKLINDFQHDPRSVGAHKLAEAIDVGELELLRVPRKVSEVVDLSDGWKMRSAKFGEGFQMGWHELDFEACTAKEVLEVEGAPNALNDRQALEGFGEEPQLEPKNEFAIKGLEGEEARLSDLQLQVKLPVSVHGVLVERGLLEDPCISSRGEVAYEGAKLTLSDVSEHEWWLQRRFDVPSDWRYRTVLLELDGVSYQADVWVNGKPAGLVKGTWKARSFDITPLLKFGESNLLSIRLTDREVPWTCPPKRIEQPEPSGALLPELFDGQHGGIKLIPIGLHGHVRLRTLGVCALSNMRIRTIKASPDEALLRIDVTVSNMSSQRQIKVLVGGQVGGCGFVWAQQLEPQAITLPPSASCDVSFNLSIPRPRLWWTHDISQPSLYQVSIYAMLDCGTTTDELRCTFGIRKVEFAPASAGVKLRGGVLRLNGTKEVLLKGTVWVIPDQLLRLSEERYDALLKKLVKLGFNCLYVHGGTLPESETFYELCDRYGILVIQELPIGAIDIAKVNADELFEAIRATVVRIRNHPSLLMWSLGLSSAQEAEASDVAQKLLELLASLDEERTIVTRIREGDSTTIVKAHQRASLEASNISAPLLIQFTPLPQPAQAQPFGATSRSELLMQWLAMKEKIETALASFEVGGLIIGQFNEPRSGSNLSLVRYDGSTTPIAHFISKALRSCCFIGVDEERNLFVIRNASSRGRVDVGLQVVMCDGRKIKQAMEVLNDIGPGERRIVNRIGLDDMPLEESVVGVALYNLGERKPLWVTVKCNEGIVRRLAENGLGEIAKAPSTHLKAVWITGDLAKASAVSATLKALGAQVKLVGSDELLSNLKTLINELEEVDSVIIDGSVMTQLVQADADGSFADALSKAVWRGVGLVFNGLPATGIGDGNLSGKMASLMPAFLFAEAEEECTVNVRAEESEHPAIAHLSLTGVSIRRHQFKLFKRKDAMTLLIDSLDVPLLLESCYGKGRVLAWVVGIVASETSVTPTSFANYAFASALWYASKASFSAMKALVNELSALVGEKPREITATEVVPQTPRWGVEQQPEVTEAWEQKQLQEPAKTVEPSLKGRIGLIEISVDLSSCRLERVEGRISGCVSLRVKNGYAFPMPAIFVEASMNGAQADVDECAFDMMPLQEHTVNITFEAQALGEPLRVQIQTLIGEATLLIPLSQNE